MAKRGSNGVMPGICGHVSYTAQGLVWMPLCLHGPAHQGLSGGSRLPPGGDHCSYGLPAAPHNANHPGGRVTYRYMPGHGLVVVHAGRRRGEAESPFWVGHQRGAPLGGGVAGYTYGLPAAPHNANHPGGRVLYSYMPGHVLVVVHSRVHAWRGREPILGGAPGWGSPGRWGCGPYRMASRPLHTTPTTLVDVPHVDTCLGLVWD